MPHATLLRGDFMFAAVGIIVVIIMVFGGFILGGGLVALGGLLG